MSQDDSQLLLVLFWIKFFNKLNHTVILVDAYQNLVSS